MASIPLQLDRSPTTFERAARGRCGAPFPGGRYRYPEQLMCRVAIGCKSRALGNSAPRRRGGQREGPRRCGIIRSYENPLALDSGDRVQGLECSCGRKDQSADDRGASEAGGDWSGNHSFLRAAGTHSRTAPHLFRVSSVPSVGLRDDAAALTDAEMIAKDRS